jgi:hypothetical protein
MFSVFSIVGPFIVRANLADNAGGVRPGFTCPLVDISRRNKVEGIVLDERRLGKWNTSFWDPKLDETFPLRGLHPDGELMPTRMEPRCRPPSKPLKNFKCS